jgi:LacI family transcriptional regulator
LVSVPSIKDVARQSGVSYKTVSRVVNGEGQVSAATRQRVQAAITALGYRPHHGARSMRRGRSETLRLIMHSRAQRFLINPFQDDVVAGVVDASYRRGYAVLLELTGREDAPAPPLPERRVDGTILLDSRVPLPLAPALRAAGVPCVVLANRDLDLGLGWIDADFYGGAERLVAHLLALGHRRIAHITDDPNLRSTQGRRAGYEAALRAAGIAPDPRLVVQAGQLREQGCAATEALLARGEAFTAIFCVNDLTAFGAIDSLRQHGLRVPEDVSVTGYDDIALARYVSPPLTTVRLPWYEMAVAAVEQVIGAIEGTGPFPDGQVLPVELCLRGSVAPARVSHA